ncbi:hypothetical protein BHM03_00017891 [Ensete ventricosum]|nr:hypothetical protein BHM03_00017891 [Ensete ventricosum]
MSFTTERGGVGGRRPHPFVAPQRCPPPAGQFVPADPLRHCLRLGASGRIYAHELVLAHRHRPGWSRPLDFLQYSW